MLDRLILYQQLYLYWDLRGKDVGVALDAA